MARAARSPLESPTVRGVLRREAQPVRRPDRNTPACRRAPSHRQSVSLNSPALRHFVSIFSLTLADNADNILHIRGLALTANLAYLREPGLFNKQLTTKTKE